MAGTGLPIPKSGGVLTQVSTLNADALSSAAAWTKIAVAGNKIADAGLDVLARDVHLQQAGKIAEFESEWGRTFNEKHVEFANKYDPDGFKNWATSSIDGAVSAVPAWQAPAAKSYLTRLADAKYGSILNVTNANNNRLAGEALEVRRKSADDDVISLVNAGKIGTPEFNAAFGVHEAVVQESVAGQRMSQERADFLKDDLTGRAQGEAAAINARAVYREQGFGAAIEFLNKNVKENDQLSLKPAQRQKIFNHAVAAIRLEQSADKEGNVEVKQQARDLTTAINSQQPYDAVAVEDMMTELRSRGLVADAARLSNAHAVQVASAGIRGGLTPSEGMRQVSAMRSAAAVQRGTPEQVSALTGAAGRLGINPRDLAAAISYETGGKFDPNIIGGKGNRYRGLIQFGPEEQAKYGIRPGMSIEEQIPAVEAFLRDRGVKPGMGISEIYRTINGGNPNVSLNASDGNGTIAQHIERIKAGHYGNADRFLGGGGDGAYSDAPVIAGVQKIWVAEMKKAWGPFKERINRGPVDDDDFAAIYSAAQMSGDPTWLREVESLAVANKFGKETANVTAADRQAIFDQLKQRAKKGGWNVDAGPALDSIEKQIKATFTLATENPIDYSIMRGQPIPEPLDMSSPDALRAGIEQRTTRARAVAEQEAIPLGNPFRSSESAAIASAIGSGDAKRSAVALDALASLPTEFLGPAMTQPIREAVVGASRSNDPARMTSAMSFMDRLYSRDPDLTEKLIGRDAVNDLMSWQSNLKYMTADEQVKDRARKMLDPQVRAHQRLLKTEGEKEARKYTLDEVAKGFDASWLPYNTPGAPGDSLSISALMGDFTEIFARRYAETNGNADDAKKQTFDLLKTKWKTSEVNGGRLMLNAPESIRDQKGNPVYPAVLGSYDWMKRQIEDDIDAETGVGPAGGVLGMARGAAPRPEYVLVSDRQTQTEAQQGLPASYNVVLIDPDTKAMSTLSRRFRFDPTAAVEASRSRFDADLELGRTPPTTAIGAP
jgi:hypothetical protein